MKYAKSDAEYMVEYLERNGHGARLAAGAILVSEEGRSDQQIPIEWEAVERFVKEA